MLAASKYVFGMQLGGEAGSALSETTFDGTLISETSFETLRSEDLLAKRVSAIRIEKRTFSRTGSAPICQSIDVTD